MYLFLSDWINTHFTLLYLSGISSQDCQFSETTEPVRFSALLQDTDNAVIWKWWDVLSDCRDTRFFCQSSLSTPLLPLCHWPHGHVLVRIVCIHMWNDPQMFILFGPWSHPGFGSFFLPLYSLPGVAPLDCDFAGLAVPETRERKAI